MMMMEEGNQEPVRCERDGAAARVVIDREARHNMLDLATIGSLTRIFSELKDDPEIRVVILTGAGDRFFSEGADLEELSGLAPEAVASYVEAGQARAGLIEDLGKPVIGAINGPAAGSGCELALACTWRIAVQQARLEQPEARLGLMPAWGAIRRLSRTIGKARTMELILTGEPLGADDALALGLFNRVVAGRAELDAACDELAGRLALNAPLAVRYALEALNHGIEMPLSEGLRLESALFGLCFATEDVKEGTRAFLEKRPPIFKGR
ncbi:MAG TPA: enoyl-CoA hydratase/isomerase family protein [Blastocatellia bacterium]|nr:enoyl-CoA hydratase/isomerase family protein [Blastocatellia bacterium]